MRPPYTIERSRPLKFVPRELRETADISRGEPLGWRGWAQGIAITLLLLVGAYALLGSVADAVADRISDAREARWFGELQAGIEVEPATPSELEGAQALFERMRKLQGLRALPYRLRLSDAEQANAFALPGGAVIVTRGLLDQLKTEAGLAMVLGHELGHHQHRHALRRLGRAVFVGGLLAMLFSNTGADGLLHITGALEDRHSKAQEHEADAFGLALVTRMYGQAPDEALEFLRFAAEAEATGVGRWTAFLSTHPSADERLARMSKQIAAGYPAAPGHGTSPP